MPQSHTHYFQYLVANIYTQLNASEQLLLEKPWTDPSTFQLVDNLLFLLSYSHPMVCITEHATVRKSNTNAPKGLNSTHTVKRSNLINQSSGWGLTDFRGHLVISRAMPLSQLSRKANDNIKKFTKAVNMLFNAVRFGILTLECLGTDFWHQVASRETAVFLLFCVCFSFQL